MIVISHFGFEISWILEFGLELGQNDITFSSYTQMVVTYNFPSNLLDFIKRYRMLFRSKCSVKDKHSGFHEVYCFKKNSFCESTLIYSTWHIFGTGFACCLDKITVKDVLWWWWSTSRTSLIMCKYTLRVCTK